jgi:hypothetical protein
LSTTSAGLGEDETPITRQTYRLEEVAVLWRLAYAGSQMRRAWRVSDDSAGKKATRGTTGADSSVAQRRASLMPAPIRGTARLKRVRHPQQGGVSCFALWRRDHRPLGEVGDRPQI